MFCHKCGNQALERAVYCQKCGAKLLTDGTVHTTPTTQPQVPSAPVAMNESESIVQAGQSDQSVRADDFMVFVDEHIRATTKFQSADDLLNNSKPLRFIWICIGVPAIVGLFTGGPLGLLLLGGLFGYVTVFIASGIIRTRCRGRFSGEFTGDINIEELFVFLNKHLKQIHPCFHEWGYLTKNGLLPILENAIASATEEVRICSEFGANKKSLIAFYIKPKMVDAKSDEKLYYVDALKNGFLIDGRAAGFWGHSTLIRTAPILQAAMEYYLKTREINKNL